MMTTTSRTPPHLEPTDAVPARPDRTLRAADLERHPVADLERQPVVRPFRTPVRGHAFAARVPGIADPTPGQFARLVREPANPADGYAVSVWVAGSSGKWRIGYLDRSVAARIAPRLDGGARIAARIDGWTPEPDGRWRRPLVVLLPDHDAVVRNGQHGGPGTSARRAAATDMEGSAEQRRTAGADRRDARGATPATGGLWGRPPGVSRRVVREADGTTVRLGHRA